MTTIATNHEMMASDLQATHGNGMKFKMTNKCMKLSPEVSKYLFEAERAVVGAAGNVDSLGDAWGFLSNPLDYDGKVPKVKKCEFLAVTSNKEILFSYDLRVWTKVNGKFYAIGSGSPYAMGAMTNGSSPREAVVAATKLDANTGMGIQTFEL